MRSCTGLTNSFAVVVSSVKVLSNMPSGFLHVSPDAESKICAGLELEVQRKSLLAVFAPLVETIAEYQGLPTKCLNLGFSAMVSAFSNWIR
jgi:hypothetical protein